MKNEELLIFCSNVKKLRQRSGLSKTKMAKTIHVGVKTLQKIEEGELPPRVSSEVIFWLADSFGLKSDELFKPL